MSIEWIGRNRKATALIRVSSLGQEGNTSFLTQKSEIEEYCRRCGLELMETAPIAESARDSELRKKYGAALKKALKENIQHLVFHKYDREARNLTDNETNERLVREGKIVLHYVVDGKVLHRGSPDSEFFNRDIQAAINKNYSRDLSTKVRKSTKAKAEIGWFPGCKPPDGYINEKLKSDKGFERRRGSIIVRDTNATTIKRVQREFEIRAETPTPSWREVRSRIIGEGLVTLGDLKKYHIGSIERRLQNIFYDGRFLWNDIEYVGKHERIIPATLFWKVQETFGIKTPYRQNPEAIFGSGWMTCADATCGCSITFDPKTRKIKTTGEIKTFKYYRCSNGKHVHQKLKNVSEESIMDQFEGAVREITINADFRDELVRAVNETFTKMKRAVKDDLERFNAALIATKEREDRLYDRYDAGEIDKDTYNHQRKRLQAEQLQYANMMTQAQLSINNAAAETVESIIELATNAESLWKHMTTAERRLLLDKLLSNRILDGVTVRYEIIKPLRALSEMRQDKLWRRERDSNS
jgi:hypothetical protein